MENIIYANGKAEITVDASDSIAVYTRGKARVFKKVGYPNYPETLDDLGIVDNEQTIFGAYTAETTIIIEAGAADVFYECGVAPVVKSIYGARHQGSPGTCNATATLAAGCILGGIVTSTSAAAVTAHLPLGTDMDAASEFDTDEAVDWSIINTGPNTVTVGANTGHSIVGVAAVTGTSAGKFCTRKSAADTFITYRTA